MTTVRQVATTAECNGCHQPLAEHGGGRREVGLCQLCHTDQGFDETGTSIELQQMIHRIHHGKELPSIVNGALGATYEVGGTVFAEKVSACAGGPLAGVPCSSDGDCPNGTCTGTTVTGVGFPQDIRSCAVCHSQGATAGDYLTKASTSACTGCHDDVNPSEMATGARAPGANHVAGAQPEAFCSTICHVAERSRVRHLGGGRAHRAAALGAARRTGGRALVRERQPRRQRHRHVPAEERGRHAAHDRHRTSSSALRSRSAARRATSAA